MAINIAVSSWNIGLIKNCSAVNAHIEALSPDFVGLQEVYSDNDSHSIADKICTENKKFFSLYHKVFTSDRHKPIRTPGNALLYPRDAIINNVQNVLLSSLQDYLNRTPNTVARNAEPRGAIISKVEIGNRQLNVIVTHLGVSADFLPTPYSRIQQSKLVSILRRLNQGNGKNTILLGDLNSLQGSDFDKEILSAGMINTDDIQKPSWPATIASAKHHLSSYGIKTKAKLMTHRIDQIYVSKNIKVKGFGLNLVQGFDHASLTTHLLIP